MAETSKGAKARSSGGSKGSASSADRDRPTRPGGSKDSGGAGRGSGSRALSTGAGKSRSGASTPKRSEERTRSRTSPSKRGGSAAKQLAKAETGGKPMGRAPSDEPDVFIDVPKLQVGKLEIDVERLQAHLALRAQVANLVALVAGAHAEVDKVKILIEDVDVAALLKVRLHNTYNILDRTLTTIDENPEIVLGLVDTVGAAVEQVGEIGTEAAKPGGALSELTSGVGDTVGKLGGSLGDTVGTLGDSLGGTLASVTDKVKPKRLLAGAGRQASKAGSSTAPRSQDGKLAKTAARIVAGGAAGLVGGALYRASRRPRVLGMPVGRKRGLEQIAKQAGKSVMDATR
jgi:hypothetical protein